MKSFVLVFVGFSLFCLVHSIVLSDIIVCGLIFFQNLLLFIQRRIDLDFTSACYFCYLSNIVHRYRSLLEYTIIYVLSV